MFGDHYPQFVSSFLSLGKNFKRKNVFISSVGIVNAFNTVEGPHLRPCPIWIIMGLSGAFCTVQYTYTRTSLKGQEDLFIYLKVLSRIHV
jgi:hypothetical protein